MKITNDLNKTIELPLPEKRVEFYCKRTDIKDLKNADFKNRKKIFLWTIKDFLEGTLSIDDVSAITSQLWKYPDELLTPEEDSLNDVIYAASELAFNSRLLPENGETGGNFIWFLNQIRDYYLKNIK